MTCSILLKGRFHIIIKGNEEFMVLIGAWGFSFYK